jgi:hypothetical protein
VKRTQVVECAPPYDNAEITALIATRIICDTLGCLVRSGHLPKKQAGQRSLRRRDAMDLDDRCRFGPRSVKGERRAIEGTPPGVVPSIAQ